MSISPKAAQASAAQKTRITVAPIARPIGDGGLSTISRAAGRNASSCAVRGVCRCCEKSSTTLADFMQACLGAEQRRIASAAADKLLVSAILDDAPAFDRDDAVGMTHRRQPVGDDDDRATLADRSHVLLDRPLTFVVERAGRLVE